MPTDLTVRITRPWWHFALWLVVPVAAVAIVVGVVTWWNARVRENQTAKLVKVAEDLERCLLGEADLPDDGVVLRLVERTLRGELSDEIQRSCISAAADSVQPYREIREHEPARPLWEALFGVDDLAWEHVELMAEHACERIYDTRRAIRELRRVEGSGPLCVLRASPLVLVEPDDTVSTAYLHDGALYASGWDQLPWIQRTRDGPTWEALDVPGRTASLAWRGEDAWATVWVKTSSSPRSGSGSHPLQALDDCYRVRVIDVVLEPAR